MNRTLSLRWDLTAAAITKTTEDIIAKFSLVLDRVGSIPENERSLATVLYPLSQAEGEAATLSCQCTLPAFCCSSDPVVRAASSAAKAHLKSFWTRLHERDDVYEAVRSLKSLKGVEGEDMRLIERYIRDFERSGVALNTDDRKRLSDLREREGQICSAFEQNVNEDTTTVEFTRGELDGVPEAFVRSLKKSGGNDGDSGRHLVGLKFPESDPVMKSATSEDTRLKLQRALSSRCMELNEPLAEELVVVRHDAARLLGFQDHASFVLAAKVAQTPDAVTDFLGVIRDKLRARALQERAALVAVKAEEVSRRSSTDAPPPPTSGQSEDLPIWDLRYYSRIQKERDYSLDEEEVSEYFPLPTVLRELMALYSRVLCVRFEKIDDEVWHPDVEMYAVFDARPAVDGAEGSTEEQPLLGHFFLDLFPRPGKFGHQCVLPIRPAYWVGGAGEQGRQQTAAAALIGNNPQPTDERPSLLRHAQVKTIFHEFGHVMHAVCGTARHSRFSWAWSAVPWPAGVEYDFLEAPSMMFENWTWNADVLQQLSGHYQDPDRKLPPPLINKLLELRELNKAWGELRYVALALFDMTAHSAAGAAAAAASMASRRTATAAGEGGEEGGCGGDAPPSLVDLYSRSFREVALLDAVLPGTCPLASFYHLVQGYDAGYYGYAWAEAYGQDMFTRFEESEEKCFDSQLGLQYRDQVLTPAATQGAMDMMVNFLGRPPTLAPFLKSLGIEEEEVEQ